MTTIRFMPGDEWGMWWDRSPVEQKMPVTELYVHHTAGGYVADPVEAFHRLNASEIANEGKRAADYTLLVHRNRSSGVITVGGLREEWMPSATKGRNAISKAVCAMGYYHPGSRLSAQPHPDELEGVAWALWKCIDKGWAKPDAIIRGHRENPSHPGASACPGDYMMPHMPWTINRVGEMLAPAPEDEMTKQEMETLVELVERRIWDAKVQVPVGPDQKLVAMTREAVLREAHQLAGRAVRAVGG